MLIKIPFMQLEYYSKVVNDMFDLLAKIFSSDDIQRYSTRFISSYLEGCNVNKIFSIWSRSRYNGKIVMVLLVEQTFGDYAVKDAYIIVDEKESIIINNYF